MKLPIVRRQIFRETFRGTPNIIVETYVATFPTSREGTLDPGFHNVTYHPKANTAYKDGVTINGFWLEDLHGDDFFSIDLWSSVTGQTLEEFEAEAEIHESVFNPEYPDANQIVLNRK
jgi:hypothetical protein